VDAKLSSDWHLVHMFVRYSQFSLIVALTYVISIYVYNNNNSNNNNTKFVKRRVAVASEALKT